MLKGDQKRPAQSKAAQQVKQQLMDQLNSQISSLEKRMAELIDSDDDL